MKKLSDKLIFLVVITVSSVISSWAGCYSGTRTVFLGTTYNCGCTSNPTCKGLGLCDSRRVDNWADCKIQDPAKCQEGTYCGFYTISALDCTIRCDTQTEADSVDCELKGNVWQDGTCKINHCKAADSTWLSTSIAACTGSNNYAIVNTDSTCEHVGTCCPNDSIPSGNTCKWRCDSVLTTCNGRAGDLFGGVLQDTSVSGQDTTFSYQCYYNCSHSPNPDSTVYLVEGNIVLSGPSDSIPDGIKSETFNSVRTTTGGVYVYDYLSPSASEYIDSIAAMKCVEHLWRCVINNKYVYWYDNQEVPAGCTNIVRVK